MMVHFPFVVFIGNIIEICSIRSALSIILLGMKGIKEGGNENKIQPVAHCNENVVDYYIAAMLREN